MKKILFSLLFAMSSLFVHAQNSISGKILDAHDDGPLFGVAVYFPELEKGAISAADGTYVIENLPKGNYKFVVSYLGYQTYSQSIGIELENKVLNFKLIPSAIEIEEVIVSTPFHKLQRENVMKVEQASIVEFKTNGAITLSDGITSMAGVSSVSTGVGIGKPVIRGLSSNRVLVYAQGIRMENQQFGDEHGLGTSDSGVASVEVIKGPASLLYGSDALGGVLYLNPEKFAAAETTEADVNLDYFSNTEGLGTDAGVRASTKNLKYLFRGSLVSHSDYKTGDNERLTNSRFNEYDFKAGLAFQESRFKTELRYTYTISNLGIPEVIGEQSKKRSPELPYQKLGTHVLSSKSNLFFDKSSLEAVVGFISNKRQEFEDGPDAALQMQLNTFSYNLRYHLPKWKYVESIVGIQGMHQTNENAGEEILIPDATTNDIGILATSHLHLGDKSDLQMGLRYDLRTIKGEAYGQPENEGFIPKLDQNFNSFNAAIGFRHDLTEHIITRINLASGFRAPNLAELTSNGVHEGTNRYEIGNQDLLNEKNFQTDLAFEYQSEHIEFFINGFYNGLKNFIFLEPNGNFNGANPIFSYQQQNASLSGGEAGFHLHPHPLDWLHLQSAFETVTGKLRDGGYIPLIPAKTLTNTLRVEFNNPNSALARSYAFATLASVFKQRNASTFETMSDAYNLLNLGFGGTLVLFDQAFDLRISGNNILNTTYIAHLSRLKVDGIANIGRNINVGISIPL